MRQVFGWMMVVVLCCAQEGRAARLRGPVDPYSDRWLYGRNKPLLQNARELWETARGKYNPNVTNLLTNLANTKGMYDWAGPLYRAESLYQSAIAIREAALGKNHPDVANSLHELADLYRGQGLYDRARPLYERALAIREAAFGKSNSEVAFSLGALADLYRGQGLYDRARPLYERALAIREAAFGKSNSEVAFSLGALADLYREQGLYDRARPIYERALALQEAAFSSRQSLRDLSANIPKSKPLFADTLDGLAALDFAQGLYNEAEPLYERALVLRQDTFGEIDSLNNLATLRLAQHRFADALLLLTRAFSLSEQHLRKKALDFSESRLSDFLPRVRAHEEMLYALLRAHPQDTRVQRLALSAVLLRKGRSVEETATFFRTLYRSPAAADRDTFKQLRSVRTQRATLSLSGPGSLHPLDYQLSLIALEEADDSLEADLAKRSAPLRALIDQPPLEKVVDRVAAFLPKDGALVEFIAYRDRPFVPTTSRSDGFVPRLPGQLRYLALVLFPNASTRAVDLGPAEPIDRVASRLRDALTRRAVSFQASAQELYHLAFQSLRPLLGPTRRILLSPDGQLGLVPFAALHDGQDFLVDTFDFTYLTSGRELLPRTKQGAPASSVFVLADPDFSAAPRFTPSSYRSAALERFFSSSHSDLFRNSWVPLPGTRLEAQGIRRLLPQARLFLGAKASKAQLLSLPTPGILHVATHGFFLDSTPSYSDSRGVGVLEPLSSPLQPQPEPLLNSGLVLAGARSTRSGASTPHLDATLVTALELAGLNLWGTQLVVLSACDTGRGEVHLGQGIYGLRRALMVAGAETVVMSLWKVNDDSTPLLMDAYYRNLLAGQGRASALREAMRSLKVSHPHPYHWAPFIALGSNAPLHAIIPSALRMPKP